MGQRPVSELLVQPVRDPREEPTDHGERRVDVWEKGTQNGW